MKKIVVMFSFILAILFSSILFAAEQIDERIVSMQNAGETTNLNNSVAWYNYYVSNDKAKWSQATQYFWAIRNTFDSFGMLSERDLPMANGLLMDLLAQYIIVNDLGEKTKYTPIAFYAACLKNGYLNTSNKICSFEMALREELNGSR